VGEIVRVLEEQSAITPCAEAPGYACEFCKETGDCLARLVWIEASRGMFAYLDGITLDELISRRDDFMGNKNKQIK
jgi:DNA-binding IscR family transcriptional regulator